MEDYDIIQIYKGPRNRKLAIAQSKFGKVKLDLTNLKLGHKPGIMSALNKTKYFQLTLDNIFGEGKVTVLGEYKKGESKLLVSVEGIEYLTYPKNLKKGKLPNIRSAIDKTKCFIHKAKEIHGTLYNYSLAEYADDKKLIKIICEKHGVFIQSCHTHLKGSGCNVCGKQKAASGRLTCTQGVDNAIVYCLKMQEESGIVFYKVGFTKHSVKYRYDTKWTEDRMPYDYEVVFEEVYLYEDAVKMEKKLHNRLSSYQYRPILKFDGSATECYSEIKKLQNECYRRILKKDFQA